MTHSPSLTCFLLVAVVFVASALASVLLGPVVGAIVGLSLTVALSASGVVSAIDAAADKVASALWKSSDPHEARDRLTLLEADADQFWLQQGQSRDSEVTSPANSGWFPDGVIGCRGAENDT